MGIDRDGDGYVACQECNDGDPGASPGAAEICDSVDNDCDGTTDEGAMIRGRLETGWTDFAEFNQNPNVKTDTEKRITGMFIQACGSDIMDVEFRAAEKVDTDTVDLSGLVDAQGDEPIPYRVVPPQGMQAVAWKFIFSGIGRWKMASIRIVFDALRRSR